MPPETPLFALRHVSLRRGGATLLDDVTLELPRAGITAIVGPSGAGKTSLLRLLNRLDDPTGGEIDFDGQAIRDYPVRALRRRVGFVFQRPSMFSGTVRDNLQAAADLGDGAEAPPFGLVLEAVGLDATFAGREAARLSGGEQQRVSIARALMTRPQVLLLDEPTSALDPEVAARLLATIQRLGRERGVAVVMVTHRLHEARHASAYTAMLEAGRLVEAGETRQVFSAPRSARARAYLSAEDG